MIEGKIGIAKQSPGDDVYHYLKHSDKENNEYTDGYQSLCNRLRGSSTIVYDLERVDLSEIRICSHCEKKVED